MEWINVKNRMPPDGQDVYVWHNFLPQFNVNVSTASYDRKKNKWIDYKGEVHEFTDYIKMWCPLIKPPKQINL